MCSADWPCSVGGESAGDELSFGGEFYVHDACGESFSEWVAGALPDAVDFLCGGAEDEAEGVVSEEELVLEGAEFSFGSIESEA